MTRPVLLLDSDGVLSNFMARALEVVASLGTYDVPDQHLLQIEDALPADVAAEYMRRVTARGFCSSLDPYPGAQDAVRRLSEIADVMIVTASFGQCPTWAFERGLWLQEHFGIDPKDVIHAHRKFRIPGDVFVDDNPKHVEQWAAAHPRGFALLWDRPYNRNAILSPRSHGWADVVARVELCRRLPT